MTFASGMAAPPGLASPGPRPPFNPPSPPGAINGGEAEDQALRDLRAEVSAPIRNKVQALLAQAKRESETKVTAELRILHSAIGEMDSRLDLLVKQLDEVQNSGTTSAKGEALEQASVIQALAKVEQWWGKELGKLKTELHQTIYAHNHNADLMKHQKETLDQIRNEIDVRATPKPERIKAAKEKLQKIDALQKAGPQKQKRLEPLMQRMAALEQKVVAAWRWNASMSQAAAPGLAGYGASSQIATAKPQEAQAQAAAAAFYPAEQTYAGEEEEDDTSLEQVLARA
eukprot:CAMPEP_0197636380 /NCGR_PEP_ID=MMETSP1338-20131121/11906_1 /TAXON_ID=43686 ORGANISM="Pelagodinium beii, Strain RCC1491" /NCGR_SAMPLE_ID=MMETSP1338 /ASSEMBLY_ACC=CAM_ASM_000754 /LENGTH=285 /DNA_ID=CAMNT_0043208597 /DNA_START=31 /DNA_END=884 /DNA_ORIENTATION=-